MKRKPWLSFLLSILKPGMGQMYNGELIKGLLLSFSAVFLNTAVMAVVGVYSKSRFLNVLAFLAVTALPLIIASEAAFRSAKLPTEFQKRKYNKWYFYIAYVLIVTSVDYPIAMYVKNNVVQAYRIPSGNMENTILMGDYILANHLDYSSKNKPEINDIIIFKYFGVEEKDYIKRIVAKSGQKIVITGEDVFVNNVKQSKPVFSKYIKNGNCPYFPDTFKVTVPAPNELIKLENLSGMEFLFLYHTAKQENEDVEAIIQVYDGGKFLQNIQLSTIDNWFVLDGFKRQLEVQYQSDSLLFNNILKIDGEAVSEYKIKNDNYFVMGDNRDNSLDSRYFGYVNTNSITGKAKFIYMSIDRNEPIFKLNKWIRWDRMGKIVE